MTNSTYTVMNAQDISVGLDVTLQRYDDNYEALTELAGDLAYELRTIANGTSGDICDIADDFDTIVAHNENGLTDPQGFLADLEKINDVLYNHLRDSEEAQILSSWTA